jgi:hypothetical protein
MTPSPAPPAAISPRQPFAYQDRANIAAIDVKMRQCPGTTRPRGGLRLPSHNIHIALLRIHPGTEERLMNAFKVLAVAMLLAILMDVNAIAQSAVGETTHLMHPSGIPATVTTSRSGTVTNVDGRDVAQTKETTVEAHEAAVKELQWGGFRRQDGSPR